MNIFDKAISICKQIKINFSYLVKSAFNSIMKFVRTKHLNTRRRRPLKRCTMPVLSKTGVQIASWNENNTFPFEDF